MTKLIKVFDEWDKYSNVIVPLSLKVDEVIFVYHNIDNKLYLKLCEKILKRYIDLKVSFVYIEQNKQLDNYIDEDTILDVTTSKYLSLVLFEKFINLKNEIVYYDDEEYKIKSYRNHNILIDQVFPLTIEDIVLINGGKIKHQMHKDIDESLKDGLIDIVNNSINDYSRFIDFVNYINKHKDIALSDNDLKNILNNKFYNLFNSYHFLNIKNKKIVFKNEDVRKLFDVSGAFLEEYLYITLQRSNLFDDVKMSTVIEIPYKKYPVSIELDLIVLKNNHMLLGSCKSNKVDADAINEIKIHDFKFGNSESSSLICTLDDLNINSPSIYHKAKELDVKVIDRSNFISNNISETILSIINDTYQYEVTR